MFAIAGMPNMRRFGDNFEKCSCSLDEILQGTPSDDCNLLALSVLVT
jgi:hypothetical protein